MMKHVLGIAALALAGCQLPVGSETSALGSTSLVIDQFYPEGGDSGANLTSSFVELFNRGSASQSTSGWSIQYASHAVGAAWSTRFSLPSATIPAGGHYLIELAAGSNGSPFPTGATQVPDANATSFGPASTEGKIAVVNTTTELTCGATADSCAGNSAIVDLLGYGGSATTEYEGTPAPAPPGGNNAIYVRAGAGCTDTDDNASDFATFGTVPTNLSMLAVHNSTVAAQSCSDGADMAGVDLASTPHDLAGTDGAVALDLAIASTDMNSPLVTGTTPHNGATGCSVAGTADASVIGIALLALHALRRRRRRA